MSPTHLETRVDELSAIVARSLTDRHALLAVRAELEYRHTPVAMALRQRVDAALAELEQRPASGASHPYGRSPTSRTRFEISVSPLWFARPLVRAWQRVRVDESTITVHTRATERRISLDTVTQCHLGAGLFGANVELIAGAERARFRFLSRRSGQQLRAAILLGRFGPACVEQTRELDRLLGGSTYLNHARVVAWRERTEQALAPFAQVSLSDASESNDRAGAVVSCKEALARLDEIVSLRNAEFVRAQRQRHEQLFATIESYPLSDRQIEAILHDEDHAIVVAGAGTGKTSTVVGKVAYVLANGDANEDEVLALAYGNAAAKEMQDRVRERTGRTVEVKTFHSLGLHVVGQAEGKRPSLSRLAGDAKGFEHWMGRILTDLLDTPAGRNAYIRFGVHARQPARYVEEFTTAGDYLQYLKTNEPRTLRGELVRSFEERLIADWMTIHGVAYEYERPYEHPTATAERKQYRPDFHLTDYGIYLEHFGIDRRGNTARWMDAQEYQEGMKWKRALHASFGTTLVETYSYERMEGRLQEALATKLSKRGVRITRLSDEEIVAVIRRSGAHPEVCDLLKTFLVPFKESGRSLQVLRAAASRRKDAARCNAFLDLFALVYDAYEAELAARGEIDFADMIVCAAEYIEAGRFTPNYTRIIVDEFQDISRGRLRLLKAVLRATPGARLFCVGDDWQSIFGFSGSDVSVMTGFAQEFGYTHRTDLDRTFRFNDRILAASSRFVQQNPAQLRKTLVAHVERTQPAIHIIYGDSGDVGPALDVINQHHSSSVHETSRRRASVMLLGRYNFSEPKTWHAEAARFRHLEVTFRTVHKAKGLEADYVILLDVCSGKFGFPAQIPSDPVLQLVLPEGESYQYAEERRLFYVALTRARHEVFLLVSPSEGSVFSAELRRPEYSRDVRCEGDVLATVPCPACGIGFLIRTRASQTVAPWTCSLHPFCKGSAPLCGECKDGPMLARGGQYRCANPKCGHAERQCPRCKAEDLREYITKKGHMAACPNRECGYRELRTATQAR